MTEVILRIEDLSKSFGGVIATDHISLDVNRLETHAIIGPNGAGKTTLLSQISGNLSSDSGRVIFHGADISRLPAHKRSIIGLARSFQITSVIMDMTVLDNVALAVQAHQGHSFRFWKPAQKDAGLRAPAYDMITAMGLGERASHRVGTLSHGEHRQLEIALALAGGPDLLLLDEPMAGMGPEEAARMVEILGSLKGEKSILLIEHDMDAVFALADRITVLVNGRVIATGPPEAIRNDQAVRHAYLGDGT